jgi:hypothetical protein
MKNHGYTNIEEFRGKLQPFMERKAEQGTPSLLSFDTREVQSTNASFPQFQNCCSSTTENENAADNSKTMKIALQNAWNQGVLALENAKRSMSRLERFGLYTTVTILLFALIHNQKT